MQVLDYRRNSHAQPLLQAAAWEAFHPECLVGMWMEERWVVEKELQHVEHLGVDRGVQYWGFQYFFCVEASNVETNTGQQALVSPQNLQALSPGFL